MVVVDEVGLEIFVLDEVSIIKDLRGGVLLVVLLQVLHTPGANEVTHGTHHQSPTRPPP